MAASVFAALGIALVVGNRPATVAFRQLFMGGGAEVFFAWVTVSMYCEQNCVPVVIAGTRGVVVDGFGWIVSLSFVSLAFRILYRLVADGCAIV